MNALTLKFADDSASGIGSLGINLKAFIFQLITFLIVLAILQRWVFPKLVATLEERRKVLEDSLNQAKQTEETLSKAETKAEELLAKARAEADAAMSDAKTRVDEIIAAGEKAASERGARIIKEAEEHLDQERMRLHSELRKELADLVVTTTEKVLREKVDGRGDRALIEKSLKELS